MVEKVKQINKQYGKALYMMLSTCQPSPWAGDQLHKDTAGSLELIRMQLRKKEIGEMAGRAVMPPPGYYALCAAIFSAGISLLWSQSASEI